MCGVGVGCSDRVCACVSYIGVMVVEGVEVISHHILLLWYDALEVVNGS